jgi:hypothetical protein
MAKETVKFLIGLIWMAVGIVIIWILVYRAKDVTPALIGSYLAAAIFAVESIYKLSRKKIEYDGPVMIIAASIIALWKLLTAQQYVADAQLFLYGGILLLAIGILTLFANIIVSAMPKA